MLWARSCRRRDCSLLRKVVQGIHSSRQGENNRQQNWDLNDYYSSAGDAEFNQIFIILQSVCNISPVA